MGHQHTELVASQDAFKIAADVEIVVGHEHGSAGIGHTRRSDRVCGAVGIADGVGQIIGEAGTVAARLLGAIKCAIGLDEEPVAGGVDRCRNVAGTDGNGHAQVIGALADDLTAEFLQQAVGRGLRLGPTGTGQ